MKIIIEGKKERTHRVTCENCKAVLDIKAEDLTLERACQGYKLFTFECPCCDKKDYIRDIDIPFKIED